MSTTPSSSSHKRHDSAVLSSYTALSSLSPRPAESKATTPPCNFLELPPDVRNLIYALVFYEPGGILIDLTHDTYDAGLDSIPALASTCRQIYNECHELPYWLNTFHFCVPVFQDLQALRAISPSRLNFSLPSRDPSPRSHVRPPPSEVAGKWGEPKALQFVTMAMRDPHIDGILQRFDRIAGQWRFATRLRKVQIDLGSITNNTFLDRVFHAWEEVAPKLAALSGSMNVGSEIRLIFRLRLSRRFVVDYDFTLRERMTAMREMDLCVSRGAFDVEKFTLPELGTINAMRKRVWQTFFVSGTPGEEPLPPRLSRTFPSLEECKEREMRPSAVGDTFSLIADV